MNNHHLTILGLSKKPKNMPRDIILEMRVKTLLKIMHSNASSVEDGSELIGFFADILSGIEQIKGYLAALHFYSKNPIQFHSTRTLAEQKERMEQHSKQYSECLILAWNLSESLADIVNILTQYSNQSNPTAQNNQSK